MSVYNSLKISTIDNVYKPAEDTELATVAIDAALHGSSKADVLDVGTGTGILGIYAAKKKSVSSVMLSDINKDALLLAKQNALANNVQHKCKFVESNLLSKIDGKFNLIIFNAPYLPSRKEKKDMLSKAWDGGRSGIELSVKFLRQARARMKLHGKVILVASSHSDISALLCAIDELGYSIEKELVEHIFFEDIVAYTLFRAEGSKKLVKNHKSH